MNKKPVTTDTPFPAQPPADLDDAAVIAAHDWAAFRALKQMRNHWDRPGWYPGRRAYYWMLTFPDHPALSAAAMNCQEVLAPLEMDPIPAEGLHITIGRIGDTKDVPPRKAKELAERAALDAPSAFSLLVGPVTGSRGAVRWSVAAWTPLLQLHGHLMRANLATGVPGHASTAGFRPHLGVAYNNRLRPVGPVIDLIAPLREAPPMQVDVTSVELVELRREKFTYRWDLQHRVKFRD